MQYLGLKGKKFQTSRYDLLLHALTLFFIGIGVAQFIYNRNLWGDEAVVARNILSRNFWELLRPLGSDQLAPLLFLEIQKLFTQLISNFEYALRFFPLLCFIGTFVGFAKVSKILFGNSVVALLAVCVLGWNYRIIYYSVESKQYIGEVLVTTWLFYFLIKPYQTESNKIKTLSIVGSISIFLSSVAPILLLCAGLILLINFLQDKKNNFDIVLKPSLWWLRAFTLNYFLIYFRNTNSKIHKIFWIVHKGFMPSDRFDSIMAFITLKKDEVFSDFITIPFLGLNLFFWSVVLGCIALMINKRWNILVLCCLPFVIHFLLSMFHAYAVTPRLLLYLYPAIALLGTFGLAFVFSGLLKIVQRLRNSAASSEPLFSYQKAWWIGLPVIFICYFFSWFFSNSWVIKQSEVKECLQRIIDKKENAAKVYSFPNNNEVVSYYVDVNFKNKRVPIVYGTAVPDVPAGANARHILEEMQEKSNKTWLLFVGLSKDSSRVYTDHLKSLGYKKMDSVFTYNVRSYLVELSKKD